MTPKQRLIIREAGKIINKKLYEGYSDLTEKDIEKLCGIASMDYFKVYHIIRRFSDRITL